MGQFYDVYTICTLQYAKSYCQSDEMYISEKIKPEILAVVKLHLSEAIDQYNLYDIINSYFILMVM